ncbi:hypothetical protein [Streptomyces natalensis]|uniref:Uncharacterized protein n=1 Tax=Streptomyces natalensis ATCC 27448 TaxID=1240678 RepID=A0A0D7CK01_9ACTN|nr:hypothetical protein [Streptomyces natalensis]KIZ15737.1 hypothetical protein SNA_25080 [Streptomyces natalensis ATCC 27448]
MSAPTPAGTEPKFGGLHPPAFGRPSPALLARADRGYARFLAHTTPAPDCSTGDHGQDDTASHR